MDDFSLLEIINTWLEGKRASTRELNKQREYFSFSGRKDEKVDHFLIAHVFYGCRCARDFFKDSAENTSVCIRWDRNNKIAGAHSPAAAPKENVDILRVGLVINDLNR